MSSLFRQGSRLSQSAAVANINHAIPEFGGDYIGDTAMHNPALTGPNPSVSGANAGWMAIQVLTTAVLNAASQHNITGLNGVSLPAGTTIYGIFSQIQLVSGSVIAYRTTD